nr:DUF4185 domain-containing protein [Prescottella equi]
MRTGPRIRPPSALNPRACWTARPARRPESGYQQQELADECLVPGRGADSNYVYEFGTPSGRSGEARLARVPKADIRNLDAYEYRTGSGGARTSPTPFR